MTRPVDGIDHVSDRVDDDQRGDDQAVRRDDRRGTETAAHRARGASQLADRRAAARADVPLRRRPRRGGRRRPVAALGRRPDLRVAHVQIEHHGRRDDWHLAELGLESDAALLEVAHHAARRVEAERAPARQHDGVDLLDRVDRVQQIGLASARRRAPHVDAANGAALGQHDRAAGGPPRHRVVPDLQARHRGEAGIRGRLSAGCPGQEREAGDASDAREETKGGTHGYQSSP